MAPFVTQVSLGFPSFFAQGRGRRGDQRESCCADPTAAAPRYRSAGVAQRARRGWQTACAARLGEMAMGERMGESPPILFFGSKDVFLTTLLGKHLSNVRGLLYWLARNCCSCVTVHPNVNQVVVGTRRAFTCGSSCVGTSAGSADPDFADEVV